MKSAVTKSWKVYGAEGHRQRESFNTSHKYDFSTPDNIRIIEVWNFDQTGTHEYSVISITRNTEEECIAEFNGQITDGVFENSRTGKTENFYTAYRRSLDKMPYDMMFWISENRSELCHATGWEVCTGNPSNPAEWWNEYEDSRGDLHYGR